MRKRSGFPEQVWKAFMAYRAELNRITAEGRSVNLTVFERNPRDDYQPSRLWTAPYARNATTNPPPSEVLRFLETLAGGAGPVARAGSNGPRHVYRTAPSPEHLLILDRLAKAPIADKAWEKASACTVEELVELLSALVDVVLMPCAKRHEAAVQIERLSRQAATDARNLANLLRGIDRVARDAELPALTRWTTDARALDAFSEETLNTMDAENRHRGKRAIILAFLDLVDNHNEMVRLTPPYRSPAAIPEFGDTHVAMLLEAAFGNDSFTREDVKAARAARAESA